METKCTVRKVKDIEFQREFKVQQEHRNDSLILLSYSILLILSVITIWIFKHKRLRFVHETGLSLLYGLILGLIFYNLSDNNATTSASFALPEPNDSNCSNQYPPDDIIVLMNAENKEGKSHMFRYVYSFRHSLAGNDSVLKDFSRKATFDAEIFLNLLLPPIIFCAGYNMKKKHFFENLGAIFTYAFVGTILSAFTVGGLCYGFSKLVQNISRIISFQDCLLFGAFISATDPVTVLAIFNDLAVDVDLYALVFGESVLNDAIAIVLAESVEKYGGNPNEAFNPIEILLSIKLFVTVFLGALSIGCLVGCLTALVTKYTILREHPLLETSMFCLMSYCSFLGAEAAGLSGIVASLFCGITQAHYTFNNLSDISQRWTKEIFELLSFFSENFIFIYIGVSTITFREHYWSPAFIVISFFAIIIGRILNIYLLSGLLNIGRTNKILCKYQHMLMFAGLRGAMAFALSIRNTSSIIRQIFFSTTLVIVMTTVFICGGLTSPMVNWLNIRVGKDNCGPPTAPDPINDSTVMADILDANERHRKKAWLIKMFAKLDCKFIKPLLTHSPPLLIDSCPICCFRFANFCTTTEQLNRNARIRAAENNFSMNLAEENPAFKSDRLDEVKLASESQFKKHGRESDLDLILGDDDDNHGYIEADESGLYIQNYSKDNNANKSNI